MQAYHTCADFIMHPSTDDNISDQKQDQNDRDKIIISQHNNIT